MKVCMHRKEKPKVLLSQVKIKLLVMEYACITSHQLLSLFVFYQTDTQRENKEEKLKEKENERNLTYITNTVCCSMQASGLEISRDGFGSDTYRN